MENSIELIWKQGFLNESSLVAPKINDLYNQKSIHLVDGIKQKIRNRKTFVLILAFTVPVIYYLIDAVWQGFAFSALILFMLWYTNDLMNGLKKLDQGATSYHYLKAFYRCLKDILLKNEKIVRYSLPLYCSIGLTAIWSVWNKLGVVLKLQQKFPHLNIPLVALCFAAINILLITWYAVKMYRWDVRITYGRLLDKLEETIAEMEKLKQGE
jgi:hypothetical protein